MLKKIKFNIRLFLVETKENLMLKVAYLVPRRIALLCFVRVYSTLDSISDDYQKAYENWEKGEGK